MKTTTIEVKFNKNEASWTKYSNIVLVRDLKEYASYFESLNRRFQVSDSEITNLVTFVGHGFSELTGISLYLSKAENYDVNFDTIENRDFVRFNLRRLQALMIEGQIKALEDGNVLVINQNMGYFPIYDSMEYRIISENDSKFTKEHIKINKWFGGRHYYAKVGIFDVIDEDGNVKWNTEQYAYEQALKFLQKLNS